MEGNGLNEIRKAFLDFYESKGHYKAKSASLIPQNDKSLLIINSGMAPLKRYFAGLDTPPSRRMTTCQKCIRTGDIDNVGKTARHGTFFEMLGNFSFGDYFKEESLTWGWEFITEVLKLPEERIWATVYRDDEEAAAIWKKLGLPEDRIVRLGKEDNFWEIGLGPCGPDSEIFYDRGPEYGCGRPDCRPGCECERYVEFWNHVFTQFSKEEDGSYSRLAHPNIDTGMGLERIACIMQGLDSIFDIDTIRYVLDGVLEKAGLKYEEEGTEKTDVSVRIITDHLRSMVFMISDGITPANEGRGYVLRRLIRRASRHGRMLGIEGAFLAPLADRVISTSGGAYPELAEKQAYIKKMITAEEEKFRETLDLGLDIIRGYMDDMKAGGLKTLDAERTFRLYDTYGFPLELTEEILRDAGFDCDSRGFAAQMEEQKELARRGRRADDEEGWEEAAEALDLPETVFSGYEKLEDSSHIIAIVGRGGGRNDTSGCREATIYVENTPFYAESGGQLSDTGTITAVTAKAEVTGVSRQNGIYAHRVRILEGSFALADEVKLSVDRARRNSLARSHTATHMLQKALREILGSHVEQAGSFVAPDELRFDFSHFEALEPAVIREVEDRVNEQIGLFLPVTTEIMSREEAVKQGAMALFGEKYGREVRVVKVGDYSIELCGGTHVADSGEIGAFRIISETGVAAGVRRIQAVTGRAVLDMLNDDEKTITAVSAELKAGREVLEQRARSLMGELRSLRRELEDLRAEARGDEAQELIRGAKLINGVRLITGRFEGRGMPELRELSDNIRAACDEACLVFASVNGGRVAFLVSISDRLTERGLNAADMIKRIAAVCGGSGGGKATLAQAGARDPSKINEAFAVAENLLM